MNTQITELKLEDTQDVTGGLQTAMSLYPNPVSPYGTIVAQPLNAQPAPTATWPVR
jgi:hypothetical protein